MLLATALVIHSQCYLHESSGIQDVQTADSCYCLKRQAHHVLLLPAAAAGSCSRADNCSKLTQLYLVQTLLSAQARGQSLHLHWRWQNLVDVLLLHPALATRS